MHAAEMCVDNLRSASMGNMNGNPEHLYGDILGWFVLASLSLLFLKFIIKLDQGNSIGVLDDLSVSG